MEPFKIRPTVNEELPVLVSIPHTGTYVPEAVAASFVSDYIRGLPMTDWHLHHLYDFLPQLGITTIYATFSRLVIDMNRPPENKALYPGRFETGLVALQTFQGEEIYAKPPDSKEIEIRRLGVHAPYHAELKRILDAKVTKFGSAVLIDAHSVASHPNLLHGELKEDIYLGNRDGATCEPWLTDAVQHGFEKCGLRVTRNHPYKGGYITDFYGRLDNVQALQIEMCQRVYMDENDPGGALDHPNFEKTKENLHRLFTDLFEALKSRI